MSTSGMASGKKVYFPETYHHFFKNRGKSKNDRERFGPRSFLKKNLQPSGMDPDSCFARPPLPGGPGLDAADKTASAGHLAPQSGFALAIKFFHVGITLRAFHQCRLVGGAIEIAVPLPEGSMKLSFLCHPGGHGTFSAPTPAGLTSTAAFPALTAGLSAAQAVQPRPITRHATPANTTKNRNPFIFSLFGWLLGPVVLLCDTR